MSSARHSTQARRPSEQLILRHCFALDGLDAPRLPARVRLEAALGPALAHRLVTSLSLTRRAARA